MLSTPLKVCILINTLEKISTFGYNFRFRSRNARRDDPSRRRTPLNSNCGWDNRKPLHYPSRDNGNSQFTGKGSCEER